MAWRAFVDEQTPHGLHIIFTNDDSLTEANIRSVWDAPIKQAADPKLRRFGKVAVLNTQAEVEAFCANEIARLEAADATDIVVGGFVTAPTAEGPDPKRAAETALRAALEQFEFMKSVQEANPAFDISSAKQAVVDAQAAFDAANAAAPVGVIK